MADEKVQTFDIPKTCKAGVVVNEGPDFHVEVQDVPVPEPGKGHALSCRRDQLILGNRPHRCPDSAQCDWNLSLRPALHVQ